MYKHLGFISKVVSLSIVLSAAPAYSLTFPIQPTGDIVGSVQTIAVKKGDTFYKIARQYNLGLLELKEANPDINPNKLKVGDKVLIPSAFILPPGPRDGVVINLAELRIYYFSPDGKTITTHPVGTGRLGWKTPLGDSKIIRKKANPTWTPPKSIRNHYLKKGVKLPASIGPGPKNPLGTHAMYLDWPGYLIHGTNQPTSIGLRSSSGCIRMYPEDIQSLFQAVPKGTKVRVIHEPFKVGVANGELYLEAHEPFTEKYYWNGDEMDSIATAIKNKEFFNLEEVNWGVTKDLLNATIGFPIRINVN